MDSQGQEFYVLERTEGKYFYSIPRKKRTLEYKITRGDWFSVEVDKFGFDIPNRTIDLANEDTVYIDIHGWKDKNPVNDREVTIVMKSCL